MKKIIVFALALSVFLGGTSAHADGFDMLELGCEDTLDDDESRDYFITWMIGYLGAKHNDTMYSPEILQTLRDRTMRMCEERPTATTGDILRHLSQ